jgi:hypothetical protein
MRRNTVKVWNMDCLQGRITSNDFRKHAFPSVRNTRAVLGRVPCSSSRSVARIGSDETIMSVHIGGMVADPRVTVSLKCMFPCTTNNAETASRKVTKEASCPERYQPFLAIHHFRVSMITLSAEARCCVQRQCKPHPSYPTADSAYSAINSFLLKPRVG